MFAHHPATIIDHYCACLSIIHPLVPVMVCLNAIERVRVWDFCVVAY